jgi:hypothetical protein
MGFALDNARPGNEQELAGTDGDTADLEAVVRQSRFAFRCSLLALRVSPFAFRQSSEAQASATKTIEIEDLYFQRVT